MLPRVIPMPRLNGLHSESHLGNWWTSKFLPYLSQDFMVLWLFCLLGLPLQGPSGRPGVSRSVPSALPLGAPLLASAPPGSWSAGLGWAWLARLLAGYGSGFGWILAGFGWLWLWLGSGWIWLDLPFI